MSYCLLKLSRCVHATKRPISLRLLSNKANNDGGDDGNKKSSAKDKLHTLLQSIVKESIENSIEDGKPKKDVQTLEYKLAKPIDENKEKRPKRETKGPRSTLRSSTDETETGEGENISGNLLKAVKNVAKDIPGDPQIVESELVQKLKSQNNNKVNLSDIFAGMKIDKTKKKGGDIHAGQSQGFMETSRAERVRTMMEQRRSQQFDRSDGEWTGRSRQKDLQREKRKPPLQGYSKIDLFGQPPLGIFSLKPKEPSSNVPVLSTWDRLHQRELKLAVTHPPANGFEEMILLTEQEKLWKFPIDNDQGRDEEAKIPFHEYIFLEPLIESWCPKKGPIRHFMELVCVALSKNAWLSVQEKRDHLEWYHQYFLTKAAIIKEVGAGEIK